MNSPAILTRPKRHSKNVSARSKKNRTLSVFEFELILAEGPQARLIGVILGRAARSAGANHFHYDPGHGRKSDCLPPGETRIIRRIGCLFTGNLLPPRSEEHTSELQSRGHIVC